jgi:hypothetical protein
MPRSFFAHSINCRCSVSVRCIVRCGPVVRCKDVRLIRLMARAAEVAKRLHEGNVWGSKRQRRKPAPPPRFSTHPAPGREKACLREPSFEDRSQMRISTLYPQSGLSVLCKLQPKSLIVRSHLRATAHSHGRLLHLVADQLQC